MNFSITLVVLMTIITTTAQSQELITTSGVPQEISANSELVTEVSKNHVSTTITVHTYKLNNSASTTLQDTDSNPTGSSSEVTTIVSSFLSVVGVTRCTFDNATQTFTILSGPTTSLQVAVDNINNI